MHLIRAIGQSKCPLVGIGIGQREITADAPSTVRLDGPVDNLTGNIGRYDLDHGDFGACDLVADGVHLPRGVEHHQPERGPDRRAGGDYGIHRAVAAGAERGQPVDGGDRRALEHCERGVERDRKKILIGERYEQSRCADVE